MRVPKWKQIGVILSQDGKKAVVALGALKMTLPFSDLQEAPELAGIRPQARFMRDEHEPARPDAKIDLRGKRTEEALHEVTLTSITRFVRAWSKSRGARLGTGAIRENVHRSANFPILSFNDGGTGRRRGRYHRGV